MDIKAYIEDMAKRGKKAARQMALVDTNTKNNALILCASMLEANSENILKANNIDMEKAKKSGMSEAFLDRLLLTKKRIEDMADGLRQVSELKDPIGETVKMWKRPNGLEIGQIRVPLGLIGIIYESRPNVTADAAGLCLKSGNAVILRGGSEAVNSNTAIAETLMEAASEAGIPYDVIQLIEIPDREAVEVMLVLNQYIDVLIPRGGAGLIRHIVDNAKVPVIQTGIGNCHVYVDKSADFKMAEEIVVNAKTQRPGVCNAMESLLVHKDVAADFLPEMLSRLANLGVEIRGCEETRSIYKDCKTATDTDYATEFDDLILSVKVVDSIDDAIEHITKYGTGHSEAIITENYTMARKFLKEVDAAAVYVNASTRFTDGFEFGFGAEIGISTQKLHARGPMGLTELTTIKNVIYGSGQIR